MSNPFARLATKGQSDCYPTNLQASARNESFRIDAVHYNVLSQIAQFDSELVKILVTGHKHLSWTQQVGIGVTDDAVPGP